MSIQQSEKFAWTLALLSSSYLILRIGLQLLSSLSAQSLPAPPCPPSLFDLIKRFPFI